MASPKGDKWRSAAQEELIEDNKTCDLVNHRLDGSQSEQNGASRSSRVPKLKVSDSRGDRLHKGTASSTGPITNKSSCLWFDKRCFGLCWRSPLSDLIIASTSREQLTNFRNVSAFRQWQTYNGDFSLNQKRYINEIYRTNGLEEVKSSKIPDNQIHWRSSDGQALDDVPL